ncbi:MAG: hypothetical protein IV090_10080 [Candidatus Sericytochromatia bacterium]|nr:hypothetical protein [Candidatus Sericytochromatia bacterium]
MNKPILAFFSALSFLLISPMSVSAKINNYYGLKTGMSKDAATKYLCVDQLAAKNKKEFSALYSDKSIDSLINMLFNEGIFQSDIEKNCSGTDLIDKQFLQVYLDFTSDNILWKITLSYQKPADVLQAIALKQALDQYFAGHKVVEESVTDKYGTRTYFIASIVDDKISAGEINKQKSIFLKKL